MKNEAEAPKRKRRTPAEMAWSRMSVLESADGGAILMCIDAAKEQFPLLTKAQRKQILSKIRDRIRDLQRAEKAIARLV